MENERQERDMLDQVSRGAQTITASAGAVTALGLVAAGRSVWTVLSRRADERLLLALATYDEALERVGDFRERAHGLGAEGDERDRELKADLLNVSGWIEDQTYYTLTWTLAAEQWRHSWRRGAGMTACFGGSALFVLGLLTVATANGTVSALSILFGLAAIVFFLVGLFLLGPLRDGWILKQPSVRVAESRQRERRAQESSEARLRLARVEARLRQSRLKAHTR